MKHKKLTGLLVASAIFCGATVDAAKLSINKIELNLNTVKVTGSVEGAGNSEILMYVTDNSDNPQKENVNGVAQVTAAEDGKFAAEFEINEELISRDGTLMLYANCEDAESAVKTSFMYVTEAKRNTLLDAINNAASAEEMKAAIENNSDICAALGMSDAANVFEEFFKDRPQNGYSEEDFVKKYNAKVFLKLVNTEKNADTLVGYFENFGDLLAGRTTDAETFIAEVIIKNAPYASLDEVNKAYEKGEALSIINKSDRSNMAENLKTYESTLEIAPNAEYKEYEAAVNEKQIFITKKLVEKAAANPFRSTADITGAIKTALNEWNGAGTPAGGGGGNGTGTGDKKNSPTISTPQVGQNLENELSGNKTKFSDVSESFWGKAAVEALAEKGIISGSDGLFRPNDKITREEFVTIVVKVFGLYDENASCKFDDAKQSEWYYKYVASAYNKEIISGMGNGNFGIGSNIKREDVAAILSRILNEKASSLPSFTDNGEISEYAKSGVALMQEKGIISGMEDGSFAPKNNCTRAEAAAMIYRLLNLRGGDE